MRYRIRSPTSFTAMAPRRRDGGPSSHDGSDAPAIVLVRPTLGENIGAAARAMMNFGLSEMRLVEPKGDWPNQKAINTASGAERILEEAKIHHTTGAAVADLQRLYATTARVRDMEKAGSYAACARGHAAREQC